MRTVEERARARLATGELAWLTPGELIQAHKGGDLAAVYKVAVPTTPVAGRSLEDRKGKAVITTLGVDRAGDIVDPAGVNFDGYMPNPVVLINHDRDRPIGRTTELIRPRRGDSITATWKFAPGDVSADAEWAWKMWADGYMNATSVGIMPRQMLYAEDVGGEYKRAGQTLNFTGIVYVESELIEFSVVTLPMNRDALRVDDGVARYWSSVAKAFGDEKTVWGPLIQLAVNEGDDEVFRTEEPKADPPEVPADPPEVPTFDSFVDIRVAMAAGVLSVEDGMTQIEGVIASLAAAQAEAESQKDKALTEAARWEREVAELSARVIVAHRG